MTNKMNNQIKNYVVACFPFCHVHLLSFIMKIKPVWIKILSDKFPEFYNLSAYKYGTQKLLSWLRMTKNITKQRKTNIMESSDFFIYPSYNYLPNDFCWRTFEYICGYNKDKRIVLAIQKGRYLDKIIRQVFYCGDRYLYKYFILHHEQNIRSINKKFTIQEHKDLDFCKKYNLRPYVYAYLEKCVDNKEVEKILLLKKFCQENNIELLIDYINFEQLCFLHTNDLLTEKFPHTGKIETLKDLAGIDQFLIVKLFDEKIISIDEVFLLFRYLPDNKRIRLYSNFLATQDKIKYWKEKYNSLNERYKRKHKYR